MKIKLDENVPRRIALLLQGRGHDVDTVADEGRSGQVDAEIAEAATQAGRMLLTLDRGFPAPTKLPSKHPGVIVLKFTDQSVPLLEWAVTYLLEHHDLEGLRGAIVVVVPGRIRIRRSD